MSSLARFSLSMEKTLLDRLEELVAESKYENRSDFIRGMIRDQLVDRQWKGNRQVLGTITLVYDHHKRELSNKLTRLQHRHHDMIMATTHVHLDEHICAEMILAKGTAVRVRDMADRLRQQSGVLHVALSLSTTGRQLA